MNLLEELGGRLCGSDFMFTHALDLIPEDLPPLEALARTALADPMVGPARTAPRGSSANARPAAPRRWWSRAFPAPAIARGKASHPRHRAAKPGLPAVEIEIPPVVTRCCRLSDRGCRRGGDSGVRRDPMICAGIDAGSRTIKVVLFDTARERVVASGMADQGVEQERLAVELFEKLCVKPA